MVLIAQPPCQILLNLRSSHCHQLFQIFAPSLDSKCDDLLHYAKSYRPFELFANENHKLRNELN